MIIGQDESSVLAGYWQGSGQTDLQYQEDVATVWSSELLAKPELVDPLPQFEREKASLVDMWSIPVVQSEQHVIYRLMECTG